MPQKTYMETMDMLREDGALRAFIELKKEARTKSIDEFAQEHRDVMTKLQTAVDKFTQPIVAQQSDEPEQDSDWKPWDALEDGIKMIGEAFDKIMEFIGTIDIDAIINLAASAIDLALLVIDAMGGFYTANKEKMSQQEQQAFETKFISLGERIQQMKPSIGDIPRAAACNMKLMFDTTYATHGQTAHQGCDGGFFGRLIHDRKLDKKYVDMARWLHQLASKTSQNDPSNYKFNQQHLATAFLLAYQASNHQAVLGDMGNVVMPAHSKGGHATENFHRTIEVINNTITQANDDVAFFEPHAYKSDISKGDMEALIARSEHFGIQVPDKIMEMYNSNTIQAEFQAPSHAH